MTTIDIHQAAKRISQLITKALQGEEIILTQNDVPVLRLAPYAEQRTGGHLKGIMSVTEDFNDPLPPEILEAFQGPILPKKMKDA